MRDLYGGGGGEGELGGGGGQRSRDELFVNSLFGLTVRVCHSSSFSHFKNRCVNCVFTLVQL